MYVKILDGEISIKILHKSRHFGWWRKLGTMRKPCEVFNIMIYTWISCLEINIVAPQNHHLCTVVLLQTRSMTDMICCGGKSGLRFFWCQELLVFWMPTEGVCLCKQCRQATGTWMRSTWESDLHRIVSAHKKPYPNDARSEGNSRFNVPIWGCRNLIEDDNYGQFRQFHTKVCDIPETSQIQLISNPPDTGHVLFPGPQTLSNADRSFLV